MIAARTTRLVRVSDLHDFREAVAALACEGARRDRLVVVPTRAAAAHLLCSIERRAREPADAADLPDLITRDDLYRRLAERLPRPVRILTPAEREILLGAACRAAVEDGHTPPFRLRAGLTSEILRFYDGLWRHQKDVDAFERLAVGMLEPGASHDRGAERLLRQTRFLVSAFRRFERRCEDSGALDEHALPRLLIATPSLQPWQHIVLTVGDRALDPCGLFPVDWDLLARIPGLTRLDVVATDAVVAGSFHERIHRLLPGIEEVRFETSGRRLAPILLVPPGGGTAQSVRDREDEVAAFARWVRDEPRLLDRTALVVHRPLPYVYLARAVLRSAGIPCQMFDTLPLAAEPYAAALDLVFSFVCGNFGRAPSVALLGSPHFHFDSVTPQDVRALDEALAAAGYLGDVERLAQIPLRAAAALAEVARELRPLRSSASGADHLTVLLSFLTRHERPPDVPGDVSAVALSAEADVRRERHLRARAAIHDTVAALRDAFARFDSGPVEFETVAALVRRWIEGQTFAPRTGASGAHVVDAASAPFGEFELVQLAGLVDGEWPEPPRRNIFYSPALLRDLGWPAESERLEGAKAAFRDLVRLPSGRLVVSTFTLEDDALVAPSSLLDELGDAGLETAEYTLLPLRSEDVTHAAQEWAALRGERGPSRGMTQGHRPPAYALSALERYQDCPFKYFAADVLGLEEPPEDEDARSPRARGRFVHEVFERFFRQWDARVGGPIAPESMERARALFEEVAGPMLARLADADASLERLRLFGSAISVGMVEIVLGIEAARPVPVRERWLEYRLAGDFTLGAAGGRSVALEGVADRVDLLEGHRLRVVDYKSGSGPSPKRALQVPIYALCAQERLTTGGTGPVWTIDEAAYVTFSGKRAFIPVVKPGAKDAAQVLAAARDRLFAAVDGIERGEFPPRPYDATICGFCPYPSVCRKDYVE
ncbi:MAG: PD-(D/E)XK nuclease family protein [Acidobacteria bacterium]|nr:PD-(D/E)XK nuclease family protein [Acidobacteriota bacterium]